MQESKVNALMMRLNLGDRDECSYKYEGLSDSLRHVVRIDVEKLSREEEYIVDMMLEFFASLDQLQEIHFREDDYFRAEQSLGCYNSLRLVAPISGKLSKYHFSVFKEQAEVSFKILLCRNFEFFVFKRDE